MRIFLKNKKGFTLVELLIVIAIITILATFLVPSIGSGRERARRAKCLNNIRVLLTSALMSAESYDGSFNGYPSTIGSLFPATGGDLDLAATVCPSTGSAVPTSDGTNLSSASDYSLVTGYGAGAPGTDPLFYETSDNHGGGRNVGLIAGNVKFVSGAAPAPVTSGTGTSTT